MADLVVETTRATSVITSLSTIDLCYIYHKIARNVAACSSSWQKGKSLRPIPVHVQVTQTWIFIDIYIDNVNLYSASS